VGSRPAGPGQQEPLTLDGDSRLASLEQDGWQVEYLSYTEQNGYWLPERIKLHGTDLDVTLVIKTGNRASWGNDTLSRLTLPPGQAQPDAAHSRSPRRRLPRAADAVSVSRLRRRNHLRRARRRRDQLHTEFEGVPHDSNLIVRAAKMLQQQSGCPLGIDIWIDKVLPMGGGIGGGSSNAATTLLASITCGNWAGMKIAWPHWA
jgi:hypothetical protein